MFPLEFPLRVLQRRARSAELILDPFVGRGTTLYAARQRGVRAVGIDCSPVAVAIAKAKLATFSIEEPLELARSILGSGADVQLPRGEFWQAAFESETLGAVCRLRDGLLNVVEDTDASVLLRATVLGILHGPRTKIGSYLSNQMPRTFSPKPAYAVRFWNERGLLPDRVDVLGAVERKLSRIAAGSYKCSEVGWKDVFLGDSSNPDCYAQIPHGVDTVITSPPYYGMRTYVADQWLRNWFLGGVAEVEYSEQEALPSSSQSDFCAALGSTWANVASRGSDGLRMFVRFGCIPSRTVDTKRLLLDSLEVSGVAWKIVSVRNAGNASEGKRQVKQMGNSVRAVDELDFHVVVE